MNFCPVRVALEMGSKYENGDYVAAVWLAIHNKDFEHEGSLARRVKGAVRDACLRDTVLVGSPSSRARGKSPQISSFDPDRIPVDHKDPVEIMDEADYVRHLIDTACKPSDREKIYARVATDSFEMATKACSCGRSTMSDALNRVERAVKEASGRKKWPSTTSIH